MIGHGSLSKVALKIIRSLYPLTSSADAVSKMRLTGLIQIQPRICERKLVQFSVVSPESLIQDLRLARRGYDYAFNGKVLISNI